MKKYNAKTLPTRQMIIRPLVAFRKAGEICFNEAALDLINIVDSDIGMMLVHDEENKTWFVTIDNIDGYPIVKRKHSNTIRRYISFYCLKLKRELFESCKIEMLSCSFEIKPEAVKHNDFKNPLFELKIDQPYEY